MFNTFEDEIHVYQSFIRNNFALLGNNYEIVKEQLVIDSGIIDILAYNKDKQRLVIIELKNIVTTDKVLTQVIKYYNEIKNSYINNYNIINPPEIIIIAPEFDKNFNLYINDIPIQLIQMDYDNIKNQIIYLKFFPNIRIIENKELTVNKKQPVKLDFAQKILINNIINKVKKIYNDQIIKVINYEDHIDILYKKMLIKINFSKKWFDNFIQLNLYKEFIKNLNKKDFEYDPAIRKIQYLKNMIKLSIIDIPNFLKV